MTIHQNDCLNPTLEKLHQYYRTGQGLTFDTDTREFISEGSLCDPLVLIHERQPLTFYWKDIKGTDYWYLNDSEKILFLGNENVTSFLTYVYFPCLVLDIPLFVNTKPTFDFDTLIIDPFTLMNIQKTHPEMLNDLNKAKKVICGGTYIPSFFKQFFLKSSILNLFGRSFELEPLFYSHTISENKHPIFMAQPHRLERLTTLGKERLQILKNPDQVDFSLKNSDVFMDREDGTFEFLGNTKKSMDGKLLFDLEIFLCEKAFPGQEFIFTIEDGKVIIFSPARPSIEEFEIEDYIERRFKTKCLFRPTFTSLNNKYLKYSI